MIKIIPAILTSEVEEAKKLLNLFDIKNQWVQLDIMDGKFVDSVSVGLNNSFSMKNGLLDVHLMVEDPAIYFTDCEKIGAKRVWIHHEAVNDFSVVKKIADQYNFDLGVALNPETDVEVVKNYVNDISAVLVLGVNPGKQGQSFIPETINRLKLLKSLLPADMPLAVDGGVNKENISLIIDAGATDITIGSAIVSAVEPLVQLEYFKKQVLQ